VESAKGFKAWRKAVASHAGLARHNGGVMLGPLALSCQFWFPRPKQPTNPYPSRDCDKLLRLVSDACKCGGLIVDDSQFVAIEGSKRYADETGQRTGTVSVPGVEVTISAVAI